MTDDEIFRKFSRIPRSRGIDNQVLETMRLLDTMRVEPPELVEMLRRLRAAQEKIIAEEREALAALQSAIFKISDKNEDILNATTAAAKAAAEAALSNSLYRFSSAQQMLATIISKRYA